MVDIILVDDNADLRIGLEAALSERYLVAHFPDGTRALEFLKENPARLLVCDLRMPGLNGFHVIKEAQEIYPELKVLLISAYVVPDSSMHQKILDGMVDAFMAKPFEYSELVERVTQLLD